MSSSNLVQVAIVAETSYGDLPAAVKATKIRQDLTYTAVEYGEDGNLISITYTGGATAGAEVVTVVGNAISIQIQTAVSTATQVRTAFNLSAAATALAVCTVTGTAGTAQVVAAIAYLAGGYGDFQVARFTSESLSGTPITVESQQIRTDRMSSGQIVTGLDVKGGLNIELAAEDAIESYLESVMYNTWVIDTPVTVNLDFNATTKELTRATGTWATDVEVGDLLTLDNMANPENETQVMVASIDSATVITVLAPTTMTSETTAVGSTFVVCDKLTIGTTRKSFSIEKKYTDLSNSGINYKGMIAASLGLNVAFGALITGDVAFSGNYKQEFNAASEALTYNRNINSAATTDSLNGSVDMPFIGTSALGDFEVSDFDVKSVGLKLNNNLLAQTAIGNIAPINYTPGTCKVDIDLSAYLSDDSFPLLEQRITQTPIQIGFMVKNTGGGYGIYLPAVQLSFDDPASGGQNQDIMLTMKGMAKVGSSGESAIKIFRI